MTVLGSGIHFQNICHSRQILLSKYCTCEIKLFLKNYTYTDGWSLVNTIENVWPVVTQLSAVLMVTDGHTLHIPTIQPIGKTNSLPNILYPVLVAITFSLSLSNACSRDSEQSLLTVLTAGGLRCLLQQIRLHMSRVSRSVRAEPLLLHCWEQTSQRIWPLTV